MPNKQIHLKKHTPSMEDISLVLYIGCMDLKWSTPKYIIIVLAYTLLEHLEAIWFQQPLSYEPILYHSYKNSRRLVNWPASFLQSLSPFDDAFWKQKLSTFSDSAFMHGLGLADLIMIGKSFKI